MAGGPAQKGNREVHCKRGSPLGGKLYLTTIKPRTFDSMLAKGAAVRLLPNVFRLACILTLRTDTHQALAELLPI